MIKQEDYLKAKAVCDAYIKQEKLVLGEQEMKLLNEIYGTLWIEAYYDCYNHDTRDFARPLAEKMAKLNEIIKFKS